MVKLQVIVGCYLLGNFVCCYCGCVVGIDCVIGMCVMDCQYQIVVILVDDVFGFDGVVVYWCYLFFVYDYDFFGIVYFLFGVQICFLFVVQGEQQQFGFVEVVLFEIGQILVQFWCQDCIFCVVGEFFGCLMGKGWQMKVEVVDEVGVVLQDVVDV